MVEMDVSEQDFERIRKFKPRFLLDLKHKQECIENDMDSDPISRLNAIIQMQEEEDWLSSSSEEEDDTSDEDDEDDQDHPTINQEEEYNYPDTFSVSDLLPGSHSQPLAPTSRFTPLSTIANTRRASPRTILGVPPLKSITTPIDVVDSADSELVEPKQPIRLFKCGKCVSVFSSQKSLTIHKLQRHMNSTGGGARVRNRNGTGRVHPPAVLVNGGGGGGRKAPVSVSIAVNGKSSSLQDFMKQKKQIPDFYESDDLMMMAGMDPKDLKCTYCPRQFPNPSTLKVHMNTHTRERSYECSYCSKRFFQSSHLTVHIRTHTGEKPFRCQFCSNAFNSPSNCRVHERTHMKGNEIYQCEECNIGFLHKSRLERHLRSRKHVHPGGVVPRTL